MTEEERAAQFREERAARCQAKRGRLKALHGDEDAANALCEAWQPLLLAIEEARIYIDPEEEELICLCP